MLLFLNKKAPKEAARGEAVEERAPLHEFIPYAYHYNPHTVLTKNGELMQIIKIANNNRGLNYENVGSDSTTVRDIIRSSLTECIRTQQFAFWIHTLRKRSPIAFGSKFEEPFAHYVHEKWQASHPWKYQYYNEIYITIIHDGQSAELLDKEHLSRVIAPQFNRSYRNKYLDTAYVELDQAVGQILQKIRGQYNAQRLTLVERVPLDSATATPIFYSEPMEFLRSLFDLSPVQYSLSEQDMSKALIPYDMLFGFNAFETKTARGQRRFGALLTLKQYCEMPPETADRLLQYPFELIVSQSFNFLPAEQVLKPYKEQQAWFSMSGDSYSAKATGLEEILKNNRGKPTDFGEHQTCITVLVDEYKHLDEEIGKAQEAFSELGLITIREDIRLEECFWSQFPGNFEFIRRKDVIQTKRIGGFCRLNRFPSGHATGGHWNDAVALIPTIVNSPYFFNFHHQDNGHTVLWDYNSFGDASGKVLLYFLLTATRKYRPKIFIFDRRRSAYLWFDKLNHAQSARYHRIGFKHHKHGALKLNPFSLEDMPRNQSFLLAWCAALISPMGKLGEPEKEALQAAIEQLFSQPPERRNLSGLHQILTASHPQLADALSAYHGHGEFAGVIDGTTETLDSHATLQAFDMDAVIASPGVTLATSAYLMHRIITELDGTPTILIFHEAQDLLENTFFAPRLESLLEMLGQNNVMVIGTTQKPQQAVSTHTFKTLAKQAATHLYLPDDIVLDYASHNIGLSEYDDKILRKMERQKGDVLVKQNNEAIGLRVGMDGMDDVKAIFANDIKNLIAAGGVFASIPKDMNA